MLRQVVIIAVILIFIGILIYISSRSSPDLSVNSQNNKSVNFNEKADSDRCILQSECQGICHWGYCLRLPKTQDEIDAAEYNGGAVTLSNHLFRIERDGLRMPNGGWILSDTNYICDGFQKGTYFVLTEKKIYYHNDSKIIPVATSQIEDENIEKIFIMKNALYALCNFKLYRAFSNTEFKRYYMDTDRNYLEPSWEPIDFFLGRDISDLEFYDCDCASNGDLFLAEKSGTSYSYHNGNWTMSDIAPYKFTLGNGSYSLDSEDVYNRIRLGTKYGHYLGFLGNIVDLVYNDRIIFSITDVWDAIIDPMSPTSVYVLTTDKELRYYRFKNKQSDDYTFDNHKNIDGYSLSWKHLEGTGKMLLKSHHIPWLVTDIETIN